MKQSESIVKLTEALVRVQGQMVNPKKDTDNPFYQKKYADLVTVLDSVRDLLAANGLSIIQPVEMDGDHYYIETVLLHISGDWISSRLKITPMRQVKNEGWSPSPDPQSIGVAITYGRRYALQSLLCIAAEDDDGNAASGVGQEDQMKDHGSKKQETESPNYNFLKAMKTEKDRVGDAVYYGVLKDFGREHSNQIIDRQEQIQIYNVLKVLKTPNKEDDIDVESQDKLS